MFLAGYSMVFCKSALDYRFGCLFILYFRSLGHGQCIYVMLSLSVFHQATEVHGIYQFDEAVQAISALKTPLRTGFLPVCLVHARTKLADVYDVRPVNADEEGLPAGPYFYPSFPPLNRDQQRVAVENEMSVSDVPDMSQLVTVDVDSISSSARRGSRDSAANSDSENIQPNEQESGLIRQIPGHISGDSEDSSDPPVLENREDFEELNDHHAQLHLVDVGSEFVSIESIVAPLSHAAESVVLDDIGMNNHTQGEETLRAEEANTGCSLVQDDSRDRLDANELRSPSREAGKESQSEIVIDATELESSDALGECAHEAAKVVGGSISDLNRFRSFCCCSHSFRLFFYCYSFHFHLNIGLIFFFQG